MSAKSFPNPIFIFAITTHNLFVNLFPSNSKESTQETEASNTSPQTSNNSGLHASNKFCENKLITETKQRPLQRIGTGSNDGYFIDDRSEININFQKYRMVFVVNKDAVFYKKSALRQARKVSVRIETSLVHN